MAFALPVQSGDISIDHKPKYVIRNSEHPNGRSQRVLQYFVGAVMATVSTCLHDQSLLGDSRSAGSFNRTGDGSMDRPLLLPAVTTSRIVGVVMSAL